MALGALLEGCVAATRRAMAAEIDRLQVDRLRRTYLLRAMELHRPL